MFFYSLRREYLKVFKLHAELHNNCQLTHKVRNTGMLNGELADASQTEAEFHMQNISKEREREVVTICIKTLIKRIIAKLSNPYCSVKTLSVKVMAMVEKVLPDLKQGIASAYLKVDCEVAGTLGKRATRKQSYLYHGANSSRRTGFWKRVPSC